MANVHQIRVRLTSRTSDEDSTESVNVRLSDEERAKIQGMATANGYSPRRGLSTFIREASVLAASDFQTQPPTRSPGELLYLAADSCGLALGAWMRLVILGTIERNCFLLRVGCDTGALRIERDDE